MALHEEYIGLYGTYSRTGKRCLQAGLRQGMVDLGNLLV